MFNYLIDPVVTSRLRFLILSAIIIALIAISCRAQLSNNDLTTENEYLWQALEYCARN